MDEKKLAELQALADAATGGPWVPKYLKTLYTNGEVEHHVKSQANGLNVASIRFRNQGAEIGEDQEDRDVQFIAAARTAVPDLVAEVRRLRAALEKGLAYDRLLQDYARTGRVAVRGDGSGNANGDDLDDAYTAWISAARSGLSD